MITKAILKNVDRAVLVEKWNDLKKNPADY